MSTAGRTYEAAAPWVVFTASLSALVTLVFEFGFVLPAGGWLLHGIQLAAASIFVVHVLLRLALAPDRRAHLKRYWLEVTLLGCLALGSGATFLFSRDGALPFSLAITQIYLLGALALGLVRANERLTSKLSRPAWTLVGGFLLLVAAGTGLLLLPLCRAPGARPWSVTDAFFTAASAGCVTGLSVRDVGSELSFRGQAVVLGLIQVGGLGLVTLTLFITFLQERAVRLRHAMLLQDSWSAQSFSDPAAFLRRILLITLAAEAGGAALLFGAHREQGAWWAVFHSVSAFCNAGFGLASDSFVRYAGDATVNLTLAGLVTLGGLGFPVIINLLGLGLGWLRRRRPGEAPPRLTLHSRLVLRVSAILVVGGALLFWLSERGRVLEGRPAGEVALASLFQSVAARTAGFNTVDLAALAPSTLLLLMLLMAVGASPASTGGGIRTTTIAVILLTLRAMLRGRERVDLLGRSVPRKAVNAAVSILFLYGAMVVVFFSLLLATQPRETFSGLLFETVSALSTVGVSTGVTPRLDEMGRLIVAFAMIVGRVGPLAVLWTVVDRPPSLRHEYPEEPVVVS